jgi:hypothetical protein
MATPDEKLKNNSPGYTGDKLRVIEELQRVKRRQRDNKRLGVLAITFEKKPEFVGTRIRRHRDPMEICYYIYSWWHTHIDARKLPPRVPRGVTISGSDVCTYCPRPRAHRCRKTVSVSLVPGIWWDLKIGASQPVLTACWVLTSRSPVVRRGDDDPWK